MPEPSLPVEQIAKQYINNLKTSLNAIDIPQIAQLISLLEQARRENRVIFIAGNGGSAATASHMACDLAKTTLGNAPRPTQQRFQVIALTDNVPLLTAWANDKSYDCVFAEQLRNLAKPGDLLLVITGSGNSPNILELVRVARELSLLTFGLLGFDGGTVRKMVDGFVLVPSNDYGIVEDVHLMLDHLVTSYFLKVL